MSSVQCTLKVIHVVKLAWYVYDIVLFKLGAFTIQNLQRKCVETLKFLVQITPFQFYFMSVNTVI